MINQFQNLFKTQGNGNTAFPQTSRYFGLETVKLEKENGESIVYLKRRFIPQADRFSLIQEHTVSEGDRLDNISHQYLGDPEQFWQLCDANNAMVPDELTAIAGDKIRITLPEGIPGYNHV